MGLIGWRRFSSQPTLRQKVSRRTQRTEDSDITKTPISKTEFIFENGERLIFGAQATNTTSILRTVPQDNVFYIVSATLGYRISATPVADIIRLTIGGTEIILNSPNLASEIGESVFNFSLPIKVKSGEVVSVRSTDANVLARANIVGYQLTLEQEKLFKF